MKVRGFTSVLLLADGTDNYPESNRYLILKKSPFDSLLAYEGI